jgi:hypothetical protein
MALVDFTNMEWRITVFDSATEVAKFIIPQEDITEEGVKRLLELLAARTLSPEEIFGALRGKDPFLEVRFDGSRGNRLIYMSGSNPHNVAGLYRKDE